MTTRMIRFATTVMWRLSRWPWWKWIGNSSSPMIFASPPVAAIEPAVSDARLVVSMPRMSPASANSWPFLSTTKTPLA